MRSIHWFRQDLRLGDNPALSRAARDGEVLCVYVHDKDAGGPLAPGGASRWWLERSLRALDDALGGRLAVFSGEAAAIIPALVREHAIDQVCWNRCYEPWRVSADTALKAALRSQGTAVHSDNGALLWEPWQVHKADGTPYKVFTPFYRKGCLGAPPPREPLPAPALSALALDHAGIDALGLRPVHPWADKLAAHWQPGEAGARSRLDVWLEGGLAGYKAGRDFPARAHTSRLSPHLQFGEISPNQVWAAVHGEPASDDRDSFCSELGWREFSHHLLYHFPELPSRNWQPGFDAFDWGEDHTLIKAWQRGQTGIPLVDAGMRELWATGTLHNRVRMVVASFLVKNLLQHWHHGARWFHDTLVDASVANNSASWQWVAGCGADAAPYFRVFNPVAQGQKFDPEGHYVRRWIPELAKVPGKWLFEPWLASEAERRLAGDYPAPLVDLKASRERALAAYAASR